MKGGRFRFALLDAVKETLASETIPLVVHDLKSFLTAGAELGLAARKTAEDMLLYAFLLSADPGGCSPEALGGTIPGSQAESGGRATGGSHACGCGVGEAGSGRPGTPQRIRDHRPASCACSCAHGANRDRVDTDVLAELSTRLSERIEGVAQKVYELAGHPFNIGSPQQLGKVLFEEMKLPAPVKWGKGKVISTAADVLEGLAPAYPVAQLVLEYRQLTKLKGTYIDALPQLIRPQTGRVHTTFNQVGAATGRLSSSNPNLQNIPIKTQEGREIRAAFVPADGWDLVIADYSQIELRLLAHMSRDEVLLHAFTHHEDIHTRTAAEVFKVDPVMVTPEMRRAAKAVNFGIVYGQTPFGLAQTLCIDRKEADLYIRRYFERYSGVREFIDRTIAEVRQSGVSKTLLGDGAGRFLTCKAEIPQQDRLLSERR